MTVWGVAAGAYLIMRDDRAVETVSARDEMQTAYEERISRLRSEVEMINTRLMLDQDAFDAKLEKLRRRQKLLEDRRSELSGLTGAVRHPALAAISGLIAAQSTGALQPAAKSHGDDAAPEKPRQIRLAFSPKGAAGSTPTRTATEHALMRLAQSQDHLENTQQATLDALEASATVVAKTIEEVFADLGFEAKAREPRKISSAPKIAAASSLGGPFVPMLLTGPNSGNSFERQLARVRAHIALSIGLYDGLVSLPVRRPLSGERDVTSRFGARRDPFVGSMAMHPGLDLRAGRGTAVRGTADGVVTIAGRNAGYGKMVEIQHKNGVSTRYAHLSAISVKAGQRIKVGDIIGRVGSTGRSTGPHLHYETRINDKPTNPTRFIKAGDRFAEKLAY